MKTKIRVCKRSLHPTKTTTRRAGSKNWEERAEELLVRMADIEIGWSSEALSWEEAEQSACALFDERERLVRSFMRLPRSERDKDEHNRFRRTVVHLLSRLIYFLPPAKILGGNAIIR